MQAPQYVKDGSTAAAECIGLVEGNQQNKNKPEATFDEPAKWGGWLSVRGAVGALSLLAAVIFLANFILTVFCLVKSEEALSYRLMLGNYDDIKKTNTALHVVINILSTALVGGSNYCLQILMSPTRQSVDIAHARGRWLNIGTPSLKNFSSMNRKRTILYMAIALSSIPLHLFYNSVIISTASTNQYIALLATEGFLDDAPYDVPAARLRLGNHISREDLEVLRANASSFERISAQACAASYSAPSLPEHRNVILIADTEPWIGSNSVLAYDDFDIVNNASSWVSGYDSVDLDTVTSGMGSWKPFYGNVTVDYCLSETVEERSELTCLIGPMIIVCIMNLVKVIAFALVYAQLKYRPLLVVGDAVSAFLEREDDQTSGMCLAQKSDFAKGDWTRASIARQWRSEGHLWFRAASWKAWAATIAPCIALLAGASALLALGLQEVQSSWTATAPSSAEIWEHSPFGAISLGSSGVFLIRPGGTTNPSSTLLSQIIVANLPQLLLASLYFLYNALWTSMHLAKEWNDYAHERKPLRVTEPRSLQRRAYWLQVPLKYGVLLLSSFAVLHFLTSQSLFVASVDVYEWTGELSKGNSIRTLGYSPKALLASIVVGVFVTLLILGMGFRRYRPGIPLLVSGCSAVISAACHPPKHHPEDSENDPISLGRILWGVVDIDPSQAANGERGVEEATNRIGHCSFSRVEVLNPIPGELYAGL